MALFIFNYSGLLILASAQTFLIFSDRVTDETTAFTSQCKLRKGRNGIRNYDMLIIDLFRQRSPSVGIVRN